MMLTASMADWLLLLRFAVFWLRACLRFRRLEGD